MVFSVGEQDHRLAADFMAEFVVRGKIDGVIERRAARSRRRTRNWTLRANRTAGTTDSAIVDLGLVKRMFEPANRSGEILHEINVDVETDDERLVFGTQGALEKRASHFLFHVENVHLAAAGIDEDPKGEREVGFGLEIFNGLMLAVLEEVEVVLGEVGDQRTVLVLNVEE